jgi:chromosome segregation ATPase
MIDKKLDLIIAKLEQHDKRFDQQDKKFELMFSRLDHHENMIVSLIKSVATNNTHLVELQADMDIVKDDVHYIKGDVTILKENQQIMLQMQQEQQKILERLSFRSITHEADIAELRRIK